MKYLKGEEILVIHSEIIDQTGGLHGVRDAGLLVSLVERPKGTFGGRHLYAGLFAKAAVYFESLAKHHIFTDGNKRTAVAATARFLFINGYSIEASNHDLEIFVLRVVNCDLAAPDITSWIKKHSTRFFKKHARKI